MQAADYIDIWAYYSSTFPSAYVVACHVGTHYDARCTVPEFVFERHSERMAGLSEAARQHVQSSVRGMQGRVHASEFRHRFHLRTCRDVGHMAWSQVGHWSPRLTLEEQILGDAGGGVVKYIGS